MIPYLLAALGGYLIGDSIGEDIDKKLPEFAEGGLVGKRIKLIEMREESSPIAPGTMGTITHVGGGVINVNWDNGRKLGLVEGIDEYEIIDTMADGGGVDELAPYTENGMKMAGGYPINRTITITKKAIKFFEEQKNDKQVAELKKYLAELEEYKKMADGGMMAKGGKFADGEYYKKLIDGYLKINNLEGVRLDAPKRIKIATEIAKENGLDNKKRIDLIKYLDFHYYADGGGIDDGGLDETRIKKSKGGGVSDSLKKIAEEIDSKRTNIRLKIATIIGVDKTLMYLDYNYTISPFKLIETAVLRDFITIDEINEEVWYAAVDEANDIDESYRDSGEGIGSSDMNAFVSRMLNNAGIKIIVVNDRYERADKGVMAKGGKTKTKNIENPAFIINKSKELKIEQLKVGDFIKKKDSAIELKVIEIDKDKLSGRDFVKLYNDVTGKTTAYVDISEFEKVSGGVMAKGGTI